MKQILKKASIVLVILIMVCGLGFYWFMGTPEWSAMQIKEAYQTHNKELGMKYIDTDLIVDNGWEDFKAQTIKEAENSNDMEKAGISLGILFIESYKPMVKEKAKEAVASLFSEASDNPELAKNIDLKKNLKLLTISN